MKGETSQTHKGGEAYAEVVQSHRIVRDPERVSHLTSLKGFIIVFYVTSSYSCQCLPVHNFQIKLRWTDNIDEKSGYVKNLIFSVDSGIHWRSRNASLAGNN